jgi:hypothetical protein
MPVNAELGQLREVLGNVTGPGQSARRSTWLTEATRNFVVAAARRGGAGGVELSDVDCKCREVALGVLASLATEDANTVPMWTDPATRQALVHGSGLAAPEDRTCRQNALKDLAHLALSEANTVPMWTDPATRQALVHGSGLAAPEDRTCRQYALRALANLTFSAANRVPMWTDPATRQALIDGSALAAPEDRKCRKQALFALANLAFPEANKAPMWTDPATRQVLVDGSALAAPEDRECRKWALSALANLVEDPQVIADVRANVVAVRAAAKVAVALLTVADAEVRAEGQRVLSALDLDDDEEKEDEEEGEEEEIAGLDVGPMGEYTDKSNFDIPIADLSLGSLLVGMQVCVLSALLSHRITHPYACPRVHTSAVFTTGNRVPCQRMSIPS